MLDSEARALLDLMEKAVQDGRPRLETLPYKEGRQAVDKMSEDSEAEPLAVGEVDDGSFAGPGGEIRFRHCVRLQHRRREAADLDLLSRRQLR